MYGFKEKCVLNGGEEPLPDKLFKNSYQNDTDGKKNFMKLWLHAYRYTVPIGEGFEEAENTKSDEKTVENGEDAKLLKVKTKKPDWAQPGFELNEKTKVLSASNKILEDKDG
jgi:hypothetical protein